MKNFKKILLLSLILVAAISFSGVMAQEGDISDNNDQSSFNLVSDTEDISVNETNIENPGTTTLENIITEVILDIDEESINFEDSDFPNNNSNNKHEKKVWICHYPKEGNSVHKAINIGESAWEGPNGHKNHTHDFKLENGNKDSVCPPIVENVYFTLNYVAGSNGTVLGSTTQTIIQNATGTTVTATPNSGYHFVNWSDGLTTATRTDNVGTSNKTFTANFALDDESVKTVTIHAQKIVCDDESDLPNWGDGDADISSTTATDWLAANPNNGCELKPWNFEWSDRTITGNPGDQVTNGGAGWTTFSSSTVIDISTSTQLGIREVFNSNYISFGGQNTVASTSAEIYCGNDVMNFDNWEWIDATPDAHYYCVAWNVPVEKEIESCKVNVVSSAGDLGVGNGDAVTAWVHSSWTNTLNSVATWVWDSYKITNLATDESKTFVKNFYVDGPVDDAMLKLAADNRYWVTINGDSVASSTGEFNYGAVTGPIDVKTFVDSGWNTIEIKVENIANGDLNPETNPAAVIYNLVINSEETDVCVQPEPQPQCSDNLDNDKDGKTDYPQDPGCSSETDNDETDPITPPVYECSDDIDNDEDGKVDETDPGCTSPTDDDETDPIEPPVYVCSDGLDNDADGKIDMQDPGCSSETDNDETDPETPNTIDEPKKSNSSGSRRRSTQPAGEVLGAFTDGSTCEMYLTEYLKIGQSNNPIEVLKLQIFLFLRGYSLTVNGEFDDETYLAVKEFQKSLKENILSPWALINLNDGETPTGYVYKTTRYTINNILCPGSEAYPQLP